MKVVILAGGLGTRLREETEFKPKPMVEVGGHPVLWHIMKNFANFGHTEFIIATGYKSEIIKDYFLHYKTRNNDFTITLGKTDSLTIHGQDEHDWKVTVADTGLNTLTGGRLVGAAKYLDQGEDFLMTYGDGLASVNIDELIKSHNESNKLASVTVVQPLSRFGVVDINNDNAVTQFREKPQVEGWISVGFFVLNQKVNSYIDPNEPFEQKPLAKLASEGNLNAFRHSGFWQPMDTYREAQLLNELWNSGKAPWKTWND
jgi:glucose-1-phosphate cytidylyltransferase